MSKGIEDYLNEAGLEEDSMEGELDWLEKQASDFLARPEIDETMQEILDATKAFTRKNFSLRAGLLYRQQLQNTPNYETVQQLEKGLQELAGEANRVAQARTDSSLSEQAKSSTQREFDKRVVEWAVETLMPALEGSEVVKITRSTKKAKNMLASCPPAILAKVGARYKAILATAIDPKRVELELAQTEPVRELREWMAAASGRELPKPGIAIAMLWSAKERKQWIHGLVEYAQALIELVAIAQELDPSLRPSKYLCYYQKRSESTLYRGQEELEAMIENMRADRLLPSLDIDKELDEWEHAEKPAASIEPSELDPRYAMLAKGEDNEQHPPAVAPAPSAPPLSLRERIAARRLASQKTKQ